MLSTDTAWSPRTGRSVYGMIRDAGRLLDDSRFKHLAVKHEESLAKQRFRQFAKPCDVIEQLKKSVPWF